MFNPNGMILWEGPSSVDGAPLVVVATGLRVGSNNVKTGAMVQTYILRADVAPMDAVKTGEDASICGTCVHRGDGTGKGRSCYVTLFQGPRGVFAAYKRGSYDTRKSPIELRELGRDRMIRLGAYGDPAAVPAWVWREFLAHSAGHTGYTHMWRSIDAAVWAPLVMASVDSADEMCDAHDMGYRTFRVTPIGEGPIKGLEIVCPASHEAGQKTECVDCKACMGTSAKARVSIQIQAHGTGRRYVEG